MTTIDASQTQSPDYFFIFGGCCIVLFPTVGGLSPSVLKHITLTMAMWRDDLSTRNLVGVLVVINKRSWAPCYSFPFTHCALAMN
jgi:hypothetical protein